MRTFLFIALLPLLIASCKVSKKASNSNPINHELWDTLLQKHVDDDGWVDYISFQKDSQILNQYLAQLSAGHPNDKHWTRDEQLAYWINAYNAFTIKIMVKHYPVASIKDIKKGIPFVNTVWDIKFINIEGHDYDLNNIEHGIIRKYFEEPRIHFAVNCASVSCPKLLNHAFTAEGLESQLTAAAKDFLADPLRNNTSEGKVSSIFSWFKGDFTKDSKSLIDFINQYATNKIPLDSELEFLDYDWTVNAPPGQRPSS